MKKGIIWPWVVLVIGIAFVVGLIVYTVDFENSGSDKYKKSTSYSTTYSGSTKTKSSDICIEQYCKEKKMEGGQYCSSHTCHYPGCRKRKLDTNMYCAVHKGTKTEPNNSGSKTKKKDSYNTSDYDDVDDFYEDYYYDFEDFDEAEQYWDEHHK